MSEYIRPAVRQNYYDPDFGGEIEAYPEAVMVEFKPGWFINKKLIHLVEEKDDLAAKACVEGLAS